MDDSDTYIGMPRKARIDAPRALHHIIVRGIEWWQIFRGSADRGSYVARSGRVEIAKKIVRERVSSEEWFM